MGIPSRKPALEKAFAFLSSHAAELRDDAGHRLSIRALADLADVSYVTMWKACRTGPPGREQKPRRTATPPARLSRWAALRNGLRDRILSGAYAPGEALPTHKEMATSLGTTHRTLTKILQSLNEQGIVFPHGRGYRVAGAVSRRASTIALVALTVDGTTPAIHLTRTGDVFRSMENECSRAGIRAVPYLVGRELDAKKVAARLRSDAGGNATLLGCVVMQVGIPSWAVSELASGLAGLRLPLAVVDEGAGNPYVPGRDTRNLNARLFLPAVGNTCGAAVASYLHELGHRHVAFVSVQHDTKWSQGRLEGLSRFYQRHNCSVDARVSSSGHVHPVVTPELQAIVGKTEKQLRDMSYLVNFVDGATTLTFINPAFRRAVVPLVEAALEHTPRPTVLVAGNDLIAMVCLDYFREAGIAVPGEVSIVSFDDCTEAFRRGLTSYNFNAEGIARAALQHILNPGLRRTARHGSRTVEVGGLLTVRRSSGPAPK